METTNLKTILNYYNFDISDKDQAEQYSKMCAELEAKGLKKFDSISSEHGKWYADTIAPLNGKEITLEIKYLFNNQWNTAPIKKGENGLRVFDWSEAIYPNRRIKQGMWLEQTEAMKEIRQNTYSCGYCGAHYYKPKEKFCHTCTGSEYLTEDSLPLLFLQPVANDRLRKSESVIIPESLIKEMQEKQLITRQKKLDKKKSDQLARLKKDIANAKKEYKVFKWLIEHNIDFENVIFYHHTNTFSFGWRNPLPKKEALKLKETLSNSNFESLHSVKIEIKSSN